MFNEQTGLLIVGHGTRSAQGQAEFLETAELLARMAPRTPVAACYLELAEPSIAQGIEQLVGRGVRQVVVLPLLLFAAGHAKEDVPAAVHACQENYPNVDFAFASHLGCHERLLHLSAQRFGEALQTSADEVPAQDTLWLMVGRGSRDPSANAEMREFVQRRLRHTPVGQVRVAYVAMAEPQFDQMLINVAELRFRRVVVQPHLLFHGELLDAVSRKVVETAARWPHQQWLVAPHLGAADLLAEAMLERFCERALLTGV